GDDFRFGSDRAGDFEFLNAFGAKHGFTVEDTATLSLISLALASILTTVQGIGGF
ncbi:MAG: bifunctional riboflavin kinase/FMN adenylyltransferase, partial [Pseudomonadales bacterium]|nr:bifunctional riboflavin kinase/FMN adenylyltransferase [Pseudomonadales bacterium]